MMSPFQLPRFPLAALLFLSVVFALPQASLAEEATIFIYHRFGDARYPSTNIAADVFDAQLEVLARENYAVIPLSQVVDNLVSGQPLPDKSVVLTVDDAFESFIEIGLPLIERHGFPVTLFVNTGSVGKSGYLDWPQIRSLQARGVEIGSHGHDHLHMVDRRPGESESAWADRIQQDIRLSNEDFQRELGFVPGIFAYPYGEYSLPLMDMIRTSGFKAAVAQQSGVASRYTDPYLLPRFPMGGAYATVAGFSGKLKMQSMPVRVIRPKSPLVDKENPPQLEVEFLDPQIDASRLNCFVNGQPDCKISSVEGEPGRYRIVARSQLAARRSKYTLTTPTKGGGWFWFSQLWIRSNVAENY